MKIFRVAFILAVMMALPSVVVAHVLDGPGAAHYRSLKKVMASGKIGAFTKADSQTPSYLPLILKLKEGADPSQLDEYGVIIMHNRQDLYLTFVPFDRLDDVLEISILRSAHLGVPESRNMNLARAATKTDEARASGVIPVPLDGTGVIVGFSDNGFDPSHINFRTSDNTSTRVKKMVSYSDFEGTCRIDEDDSGLTGVQTDNVGHWHATHVAGCMTGSYMENGYSGAAPGADIVATCSSLYDATILAGIEEVIAYSKKTGRPSVVNLSVGSYNGPHDGTDLFCQYLDLLGKETIVCISSGNEAIQHSCQAINFTDEKPVFHTAIYDTYYQNGVAMQGYADFWSESEVPFESAICIYDRDAKQMVYESEFSTERHRVFDESHEEFTRYFGGSVTIDTYVGTENGRFTTLYSYDMKCRAMTEIDYAGKLGKYVFGVVLRGPTGLYVEGYTDSTNSLFHSCSIPGWSYGSNFNCVSNIACGKNVIVVGSYNTRNSAPLVNGGEITYPFEVGVTSNFSGFGTLIDGRKLPHVTGPGNYVVSSVSSAFTDEYIRQYGKEQLENEMSAKVTDNGKDYYWSSECGTSMSCPIVAGTIAQWLQVYPEMTVEEARDVAITTGSSDPPRVNALDGVRKVAEMGGVSPALADDSRLVVSNLGNNHYRIVLLGAKGIVTKAVTTYGVVVKSASADGDSVDLDLSEMGRGIVVLSVTDGTANLTSKLVINN